MSPPNRRSLALRPFADVFAIAAAQFVALVVNMIDDVALFGAARFDRRSANIAYLQWREAPAALNRLARQRARRGRP